jgi:WD40 repeat protein
MRYSPCETFLAAGSHDCAAYIWRIDEDGSYHLDSKFDKNSSFITSLDWSADSTCIRTNSGDYAKLIYSVEKKEHLTHHDASQQLWATNTSKLEWTTYGVYPQSEDGSHINSVWKNNHGLLFSADDYGLINVFNENALDSTHEARSYNGHSEHVVRVISSDDGARIWSVGGNDKTIIQWRRK